MLKTTQTRPGRSKIASGHALLSECANLLYKFTDIIRNYHNDLQKTKLPSIQGREPKRSRGTTQIPSNEGTLRGPPSPAPLTVGVRLAYFRSFAFAQDWVSARGSGRIFNPFDWLGSHLSRTRWQYHRLTRFHHRL